MQASALNVGSDGTILRVSFFEILQLILHALNVNLGRFIFSCFNQNVNSPIRIAKHVFSMFNFQSVQLMIKSTMTH